MEHNIRYLHFTIRSFQKANRIQRCICPCNPLIKIDYICVLEEMSEIRYTHINCKCKYRVHLNNNLPMIFVHTYHPSSSRRSFHLPYIANSLI